MDMVVRNNYFVYNVDCRRTTLINVYHSFMVRSCVSCIGWHYAYIYHNIVAPKAKSKITANLIVGNFFPRLVKTLAKHSRQSILRLPVFLQFILTRLTTKQADPLIFSRNADCQWVCCSQIESHKSSWEH